MTTKRTTQFERDCRAVAEETGIEVDFFYNEKGSDCYEDDGNLHIHKSGMRAVFNVGHNGDLPGAEQNERTRKVLNALGMGKKISDRVLVTEEAEEDDDDVCGECGRPW
jgi:hypothetical protein